jgi:Tfp pilus assembly protein PilE
MTPERHTALVEFSSIVSVIALLLSLLSAWYARHAARAARAQADAAKQQAAAARAQLSLDQDRRNEELARKRKEDEHAARADLRVTLIWVRPHPPQIVLHNYGPHVASEISLNFLDADDGLPPPDTSRWHELSATLGPERASSVEADFGLNATRRFRVTLRWKDGTGSRSEVEHLQLH